MESGAPISNAGSIICSKSGENPITMKNMNAVIANPHDFDVEFRGEVLEQIMNLICSSLDNHEDGITSVQVVSSEKDEWDDHTRSTNPAESFVLVNQADESLIFKMHLHIANGWFDYLPDNVENALPFI